jgi:hypothetical protein
MAFGWLRKIWKKIMGEEIEEEKIESVQVTRDKTAPLILKYELDLKDRVHEIMAVKLAKIARLYPANYDMIQTVLKEYTALVEEVLIFRETGKPEGFFNRLQEFIDVNIKPFLKKEPEKLRNDVELEITDAFITIEEIVAKYEDSLKPKQSDELITPIITDEDEFQPDWTEKIARMQEEKGIKMAGKKFAQESLKPDDPVEKIKGIGAKRADYLKSLDVNTVEDYYKYLELQENNNLE